MISVQKPVPLDEQIDVRVSGPIAPPTTVDAPVHDARPAEEPVLRIENLSVHYGSFQAVSDVNFDVPKNRITALIGPSGCGKSTV